MAARNDRIPLCTRRNAVPVLNRTFFAIITRMKNTMSEATIASVLEHCDQNGDNLFRNASDVSEHIASYILLRNDVKINFINNFATGTGYKKNYIIQNIPFLHFIHKFMIW